MVHQISASVFALPLCIIGYTVVILIKSFLPYLSRYLGPRVVALGRGLQRFGELLGRGLLIGLEFLGRHLGPPLAPVGRTLWTLLKDLASWVWDGLGFLARSARLDRLLPLALFLGRHISTLGRKLGRWVKLGFQAAWRWTVMWIMNPPLSGLGPETMISCALSLGYGYLFLTSFRTTVQAMSYLVPLVDCSTIESNVTDLNPTPEVELPFYKLIGLVQVTPLVIYRSANSTNTSDPCYNYLVADNYLVAANFSSTDFNQIFNTALVPLLNFGGTDIWDTYSGAGVLNPNFGTIIGSPIGAFGMFKGGLKKLFPRHVRNMDWTMMDIAGSRKRFLSYKLWTRHYTHIDPTREFEGNYFRRENGEGEWKWKGKRKLPGFTRRPHGEYMHGTSDDLMHLGPNETIVNNDTVREFNSMLIRNVVSSVVRGAIAIDITVTPILVVRQLQNREAVVDDTSYFVMELWIAAALLYSVACVLGGWLAFHIGTRSTDDPETEVLVTYYQTGAERYRMGTYYSKGPPRYQKGFHKLPFQLAAFTQGIVSVFLSALAALTLVSIINAVIWIILHATGNRFYQTCLWLPSVLVAFYRFLFVLPASRAVDERPFDGTLLGGIRRIYDIPIYNWLARVPQLSGQEILTKAVYEALKLDPETKERLGTHFLAPMRLSWLCKDKAVVKTTLHGGYYQHFPTKMLLENKHGHLHLTFSKKCLMDGALLVSLVHAVASPLDRRLRAPTRPENLERIDPTATYFVIFGRHGNGEWTSFRAIRIPGEPWLSRHDACSTLYVGLDGDRDAPNPMDKPEDVNELVYHPKDVCVTVRLPENYAHEDRMCPDCRSVPQQREFLQTEFDNNAPRRDEDKLRPAYAVLYRHYPSKPYALFSGRRSGEVVARRLPGLLNFGAESKLVCVQHIVDKDPHISLWRRIWSSIKTAFRIGLTKVKGWIEMDMDAGRLVLHELDNLRGAGAADQRIPPPDVPDAKATRTRLYDIDLNHNRRQAVEFSVFEGGQHLESRMMVNDWKTPPPHPAAQEAPIPTTMSHAILETLDVLTGRSSPKVSAHPPNVQLDDFQSGVDDLRALGRSSPGQLKCKEPTALLNTTRFLWNVLKLAAAAPDMLEIISVYRPFHPRDMPIVGGFPRQPPPPPVGAVGDLNQPRAENIPNPVQEWRGDHITLVELVPGSPSWYEEIQHTVRFIYRRIEARLCYELATRKLDFGR